jgi:hypothetical protein
MYNKNGQKPISYSLHGDVQYHTSNCPRPQYAVYIGETVLLKPTFDA